jgi:hypothetical protein
VNEVNYEEWRRLCQEHDAAREEFFSALSVVNKKYSAISQGRSGENPTEKEQLDFESTLDKWQRTKQRMEDFVKNHS